jgi:UDP-glucose 4-epimerase
MKVLVTGAGGFLGAHIIKSLSESNHEVIGATTNSNLKSFFVGDFELKEINWESKESLLELCTKQDVVIHAAGMNSRNCELKPEQAFKFNGDATAQLVKAAVERKVKNFIYLSTVHVYADPLQGCFDEKSLPRALNSYATSHLIGEQAVLERIAEGQLQGTILRVGNTFGKPARAGAGQIWSSFVNQCCKSLVETNAIILKNNPRIQRDFVPVSYFLQILKLIVNQEVQPNQNIVNVVSGMSLSLLETLNLVLSEYKSVANTRSNPKVFFSQPESEVGELEISNSNSQILNTLTLPEIKLEIRDIFSYLMGGNSIVK